MDLNKLSLVHDVPNDDDDDWSDLSGSWAHDQLVLLGDTIHLDGAVDGTTNDGCDDDRQASMRWQFGLRVNLC